MTASILLLCIGCVLLIQLAGGIGLALLRHRRAEGNVPAPVNPASAAASDGAWSGWREFRVARREFEDRAQTQCSFYLEPVDGVPVPKFRAGQYLTFSVPVMGARPIVRCYSLSDTPDAPGYRITVKRLTASAERPDLPPGASSNYFHDSVHEGDILKVRAPSGRFCLDDDPVSPVVFIAGGIGITPLLSMLSGCVTAQPGRTIHLFYAVRSGAEHAFKTTLDTLLRAGPAIHLHVLYSRPGPEDLLGRDYHHAGRLDVNLLRSALPPGRHQFYVCGPPSMMNSLIPSLREWGVPAADIHFEAFGPASGGPVAGVSTEPSTAPETSIEVRFQRSARTLIWDGQDANLLDLAERHAVVVDSGCRSGSCGTCETRLVSGTVDYAVSPDHETAAGHCLLCVARPQSPLVLDA